MFSYWLIGVAFGCYGGGKYSVYCKTFRYSEIEMNLSFKLLLIMLNKNYLVIKLFLSLYLVHVYSCNMCLYVGAYVYHE